MKQQLFTVSLGVESATSTSLCVRGRVVTPSDVIDDGAVVIDGDAITCVGPYGQGLPPYEMEVATGGTIVAGFVDAHNHPECAAVRRWCPGPRFTSRAGWRGLNRCQQPAGAPRDPFYEHGPYRELKLLIGPNTIREAILYGQVRGVIGGATAMVLDANAVSPPLPPSSVNRGANVDVMTILDPACLAAAGAAVTVADVAQHLLAGGRVHAHCAEGVPGDAYCAQEFDVLERNGLLKAKTTLIHGLGLDSAALTKVAASGASMVWSPVSNLNLYGATIDAQDISSRGIPLALAPDWTVSGSSTILDEARFVLSTFHWIRPTQVLSMVTEIPARLLGLTNGVLASGRPADLVVFEGVAATNNLEDTVRDVLSRRHEDIGLVVSAGVPVYGTPGLMSAAGSSVTSTLHVPTSSGATVERQVAIPASTWSNGLSSLRGALQRDPAPLWEAP